MIKYLSNKVLQYLIMNNAINDDEDQCLFYSYSIEITISSLLNIIIILVLSIITNSLILGISFLLTFIPIRQFTGGYHAKTYFRCNFTFAVCYILTLAICKITYNCTFYISILLFVIELIFIILYCPIVNENKPIDSKKKCIKLKSTAFCMYLLYWSVGMYLFKYKAIELGYMIICTLYSVTMLGIVAKLEKGEKQNEEKC